MNTTEYMPIFRNIYFETGAEAREINWIYQQAEDALSEICSSNPPISAIQAQTEFMIKRYQSTSQLDGISLAPLAMTIIKLSKVFYR